MTVAEMHTAFKLGVDNSDILTNPGYEPEEVDFWLNQAYQRFIKQRSGLNNVKRESVEEIQKRIDDLRGVTVTSYNIAATQDVNDSVVYNVPLPADYWFRLRSKSAGTGILCKTSGNLKLSNKVVTNDNIEDVLDSPFKNPDKTSVVFLFEGNTIKVYTDGSTVVTNLTLTYIKKPLKLSITATGVNTPAGETNIPETADHTHSEIVDLAVTQVLENQGNERYQSNLNELNKQE